MATLPQHVLYVFVLLASAAGADAAEVTKNEKIQIFFRTTMGPTVFTVAQPDVHGITTIVPQLDYSASLTFTQESVTKMIATTGITVKETSTDHPKKATCDFSTAGPITGPPFCTVMFSRISMYCECINFPRAVEAEVAKPIITDENMDEDIKVLFQSTMGRTVLTRFTVAQPAIDGTSTIVPQLDGSASLTFSKESVMNMIGSSGITVKETDVEHPKKTTCRFLTAGPITGVPTCTVMIDRAYNLYCSCDNFPRAVPLHIAV